MVRCLWAPCFGFRDAQQSVQWLVQLDPISFGILDPREPPVVEILGLLDLDGVRLQLLEKGRQVADSIVDSYLFPLWRQRHFGLGYRENRRVDLRRITQSPVLELRTVNLPVLVCLELEPEVVGVPVGERLGIVGVDEDSADSIDRYALLDLAAQNVLLHAASSPATKSSVMPRI